MLRVCKGDEDPSSTSSIRSEIGDRVDEIGPPMVPNEAGQSSGSESVDGKPEPPETDGRRCQLKKISSSAPFARRNPRLLCSNIMAEWHASVVVPFSAVLIRRLKVQISNAKRKAAVK